MNSLFWSRIHHDFIMISSSIHQNSLCFPFAEATTSAENMASEPQRLLLCFVAEVRHGDDWGQWSGDGGSLGLGFIDLHLM